MKKDFDNKSVLITGGTGSFGNAFLQYILKNDSFKNLSEIRILSRDECKQDQMRNEVSSDKVKFYVADIRDKNALYRPFEGCDYIFHAAALKQVPSCEFFPIEAVKTNIIGSQNVLEVADDVGVKTIIGLSTDKAVFPINAMGMTKSLMEKVFQAFMPRGDLKIANVRYGNVLMSRGSVIPLFINQIKNKIPITVTVPEMTRFLLPLLEAIELVHFALENAKTGQIFIKKASSARVIDIATAVNELMNSSSDINIIGKRHGEKLYETLATSDELNRAKEHEDFFCIEPDQRDLNYSKYFDDGIKYDELSSRDDFHSHNAEMLNVEDLKSLLLKLPEFNKAIC